MKQDKTCKFSRKSFFSSYIQQQQQQKSNNRKTNYQFNLCQLDVGDWQKETASCIQLTQDKLN